jgi:ribonuclease-3
MSITDIKQLISDESLYQKAFTHRSYLNESDSSTESNERLEFLGDAVLELLVSKFLYLNFPDKPEGELTVLRAALVRTTTLAEVAQKLGFGMLLKMSKGEEQTGGRDNTGLLANTFEAVIGAIYLAKGLKTVRIFLQQHLFILLPEIISQNLYKDYKSSFQEKVQSMGIPTPTYQLLSETGPDHSKTFEIALLVNNKQVTTGFGKSKQLAQQEAAKKALEQLDRGQNF